MINLWWRYKTIRYETSLWLLGIVILIITIAQLELVPFILTAANQTYPFLIIYYFDIYLILGICLIVGGSTLSGISIIRKYKQLHMNKNILPTNEPRDQIAQIIAQLSPNTHINTQIIINQKFSIKNLRKNLKYFISTQYLFWLQSFPPWFIVIIGIVDVELGGLFSLWWIARFWGSNLSTVLLVFVLLPVLIIMPFILLPTCRELTNRWGETYFALPTTQLTFVLGRFYTIIGGFLGLIFILPLFGGLILELLVFHTLFLPPLYHTSTSSPYPPNFDQFSFFLFYILCLFWNIGLLVVMGMVFVVYLVVLQNRALALGLYYLTWITLLLLTPSLGTLFPVAVFNMLLPYALASTVFPAALSSQINPVITLTPFQGSLDLLFAIGVQAIILIIFTFVIVQRLKHWEIKIS